MSRFRCHIGGAVALILLLSASESFAICTVLNSPKRFVGDTSAVGTQCTDNDIQSAIDAVAAGTNTCPATIYVTHDHTYTSQHLVFDNTNRIITLVGLGDGVPCGSTDLQVCNPTCPPPPTSPLLTISGAYPNSVIHLNGTNTVKLQYLTINGGSVAADGNGGGIYFSGSGALTLDTTTVGPNYAGYGGGIYFNGEAMSTLTLLANTLVVNNTAQFSGGGIRIEGNASLLAEQAGTTITLNEALGHDPISNTDTEGYGGGIEIVGPAHADIGSPGYNGLAVLYGNSAIYGGAITVFAGADAYGSVSLYTTDPLQPTAIDGNFAAVRGGAIYARGSIGSQSRTDASVCAANFRIVHNAAPDGAAVYLDRIDSIQYGSAGSNLILNGAEPSACAVPGVACAAGVACNEMVDNESKDANDVATDGPAIVVASSSSIAADKLDLRGGNGAHAIVIVAPDDTPGFDDLLRNCLIADNVVSQELIVDDKHTLTIDNCTIAGNSIGAEVVTTHARSLTNSMIFQPGAKVAGASGDVEAASYDLANDLTNIPVGPTVHALADPGFVDAGHGDYHLLLSSPAVDYAGGAGGTDLDANPRDVDLAAKPNTYGPRDAGAYERQSAYACDDAPDALFCATFDL